MVSKPAMKARCENQNLLCSSLPGAAGLPTRSQGGGCRAGAAPAEGCSVLGECRVLLFAPWTMFQAS